MQGTSLIRRRNSLGPYSRPTPSPTVILGGGAAPYERGNPVLSHKNHSTRFPRKSLVSLENHSDTSHSKITSRLTQPGPGPPFQNACAVEQALLVEEVLVTCRVRMTLDLGVDVEIQHCSLRSKVQGVGLDRS